MATKRPDRARRPDLLYRPPAGVGDRRGHVEPTADPVAQLHGLADLQEQGVLGPEEYELCREMLLNAYR